nr:MAG TPA: hypothetical protein [Caudoviricetes sp.]
MFLSRSFVPGRKYSQYSRSKALYSSFGRIFRSSLKIQGVN